MTAWQTDHVVFKHGSDFKARIDHERFLDVEYTVEINDHTHGVNTKGVYDLVLFVTNGDNDLRICTYKYNGESEQYEQVANTANLSEYVDVNLAEWRKFYYWLAAIVSRDLVQENATNTFHGRWILDNLERVEKYFDNLQEKINAVDNGSQASIFENS